MNKQQYVLYFWVDEFRATHEELFAIIDEAFRKSSIKKEKLFNVEFIDYLPEPIYMSLN